MRQFASHAVSRTALLPAAPTPRVVLGDPARQHRTISLHSLPGHLQPELIQAAKSGQVGAAEAAPRRSVRHVEVFQIRRVGTLILGRPRPLPRQRRADQHHTLICEEPVIVATGSCGVQAAVTRRDLDVDKIAPTTTALSLTTGIPVTAAGFLLADPISRLLGSPESATPIRILSLCLLTNAVFAVLMARNQREFRQDIAFRGQTRAFGLFAVSSGIGAGWV